jgi:hypothetical protein
MSDAPDSSPAPAPRVAIPHVPHGVDHSGGPRWVPVAAAVLAVLSAVSGYLASTRQSEALIVKDDAVVAVQRAADHYNRYESARIQATVYQAAIDAGTAKDSSKLQAARDGAERVAGSESDRWQAFEHEALVADARSARLSAQHATIEVGTTLFEVAIVLVSITALVGSRVLPIAAGCAALIGLGFALAGALR